MATSLPPQRKPKLSEPEIEAIINRGGAAAPQHTEAEASKRTNPKFFNVRLSVGIFEDIDALREKRPRKPGSPKLGVSTHDWIVEAVMEKLARDQRKLQRESK